MQELFKKHWKDIKTGKCNRIKQTEKGTLHKVKDKKTLMHLLTNGWNTPISVLEQYNPSSQSQTKKL